MLGAELVPISDVVPMRILKLLSGYIPKYLPRWCLWKEYRLLDADMKPASEFNTVFIEFRDGRTRLLIGPIFRIKI